MHCNALVMDGKLRCSFAGERDELVEHAAETGHDLCLVCAASLSADEARVCARCLARTRDDLDAIVDGYARLPAEIENVWRGGMRWDALTMWADGSVESAVQSAHPEQYRDVEWISDPTPVIAILESWQRTWRQEFGQGPAEEVATVTSCAKYLATWQLVAARQLDSYADFTGDVAKLRRQLDRVTGRQDGPIVGAKCVDCGAALLRQYRAPVAAVPDASRSEDGRRGRDDEGLSDCFACPRCYRVYSWHDYGSAVHRLAASVDEWVPVRLAADVVRRPIQSLWRWVREGEATAACRVQDRRVVVDIEQVRELSDVKARHGKSGRRAKVAA